MMVTARFIRRVACVSVVIALQFVVLAGGHGVMPVAMLTLSIFEPHWGGLVYRLLYVGVLALPLIAAMVRNAELACALAVLGIVGMAATLALFIDGTDPQHLAFTLTTTIPFGICVVGVIAAFVVEWWTVHNTHH